MKKQVTLKIKNKEEHFKEQTKKISITEGAVANVMDGAGSRYITPYALAIGANNTQIGLLTSIPSLLGNLSQLFSSRAIEKYSRKKIVVISIFLQALMWLPMIAVGFFFFNKGLNHGLSASLMIIFYTLFIIFGAFLSPAWNSLMKDVVSKETGKYFGKKNKIGGAISLGVMLLCGFILNYFQGINNLFIGFLILFGIAFISRLVSGYLATKYYEPKLKFGKDYYFTFWQFLKKIPESNFGKFTVFISLINLGTAIASPFFAVYMLKDLSFTYTIWTIIVISSSLGSLFSMPLWGKIADKYGNLKVLRLTGVFIPLVPIMWLLTPWIIRINPTAVIIYLFAAEFISGLIWAGFNLSTVNFIYDAVTRQRVALCVAYFNILNGIGVFIGATLGGFLASMNINIFGMNSLLFIFLLSGISRFMVYIVMIPKIKEVREVEKYEKGGFQKEFQNSIFGLSNKITRPRPGPP
ncbi:MAG: MFS transporter [Candidatus Pacearchaeota archaeon]|nr:MFS transporter [Candidatus Pacearchaeota archaeon]